jgi:hypothetical protein
VDIHFIHVRSKHPNALPVIITHGWPGSIIEQMEVIDPLTTPQHMAAKHRTPLTLSFPRYQDAVFQGSPPLLAGTPFALLAPGLCS